MAVTSAAVPGCGTATVGKKVPGRDPRKPAPTGDLVPASRQESCGHGDRGKEGTRHQLPPELLNDDAELDCAQAAAAMNLSYGDSLHAELARHAAPQPFVGLHLHRRQCRRSVFGEQPTHDRAQFDLLSGRGEQHWRQAKPARGERTGLAFQK